MCFGELWGICADCCFKVLSGSTDELWSYGLDVSDKVSDKANHDGVMSSPRIDVQYRGASTTTRHIIPPAETRTEYGIWYGLPRSVAVLMPSHDFRST